MKHYATEIRNTSDLLKVVVKVKVVPDDDPNATGEWAMVSVHENRKSDFRHLSNLVPEGFHVVAVG